MTNENNYPTEEELRDRIVRQLGWRGPTNTVVLLWRGYLSALLEWGVIEVHTHDNLSRLLPKVGNKELYEIFSGEPLTTEQEREIDEYLTQQSK